MWGSLTLAQLQCSAKIVTNSVFSDLSMQWSRITLLSFAIGNHNSDSLLGTSQVVSIINKSYLSKSLIIFKYQSVYILYNFTLLQKGVVQILLLHHHILGVTIQVVSGARMLYSTLAIYSCGISEYTYNTKVL